MENLSQEEVRSIMLSNALRASLALEGLRMEFAVDENGEMCFRAVDFNVNEN